MNKSKHRQHSQVKSVIESMKVKLISVVSWSLVMLLIACGDKEELPSQLDLNFKIEYGDEPLVLLNDYEYPDGRKINFTRFSFYISSISLIDEQGIVTIKDVDFINTTSNLVDEESSRIGTTISIEDVPIGAYERVQFNFGLDPSLNSMIPADFPSDHPCARPAEYWIAWDSFVFTKIEGNVDLDNNGTLDNLEGMSLHMGSDDVLKTILIDKAMSFQEGSTEELSLTIDIRDCFIRDEQIYDIEAAPQIHSLSQLEYAQELSDNLGNSLSLN